MEAPTLSERQNLLNRSLNAISQIGAPIRLISVIYEDPKCSEIVQGTSSSVCVTRISRPRERMSEPAIKTFDLLPVSSADYYAGASC